MDGLKMKHDEEISAPIKIVICVGMLPKEYQDMCFQQAAGVSADSDVKYDGLRDKIINIASQRVSMITPTPMDIDIVKQQSGEVVEGSFNLELWSSRHELGGNLSQSI